VSDHFIGDWPDGSYWEPRPQNIVPLAADHDDYFTGLLDHKGNRIYRAPRPIGFHTPRGRR
jgi:hypothetical protein